MSAVEIAAWLIHLAEFIGGGRTKEERIGVAEDYARLLEHELPVGVRLNDRTMAFVARRSRHWPSFSRLCELLEEACPKERPRLSGPPLDELAARLAEQKRAEDEQRDAADREYCSDEAVVRERVARARAMEPPLDAVLLRSIRRGVERHAPELLQLVPIPAPPAEVAEARRPAFRDVSLTSEQLAELRRDKSRPA